MRFSAVGKGSGGDMIEVVPWGSGDAGARLRLRPPRALTAYQFKALFAVLAGAMWLVAGIGWLAGNVFAPVFALLHSAGLAASLRWLWRSGERCEDIAIAADAVEVRRGAERVFSAHPYWVRMRVEGGEGCISLSSSDKRVEVGSFLGPAERSQLVRYLDDLLAAVSGRNR